MPYYAYGAQWNGRLPTAKTLQHIATLGPRGRNVPLGMERAKELRKLLEEKDLATPRGVLLEINRFVGGFGVESLAIPGALLYFVNMGDAYDHTVLFNQKTGNIYCGSWGDFVESRGL